MKKHVFTATAISLLSLAALGSLTGCQEKFDGLDIIFWHTFGKTPEDAISAQAKQFAKLVEENEGVKCRISLVYKGGYGDVLSNVSKSFAGGNTPTITVAYPDHVADYFAAEHTPGQYVVDLSKFANDSEIGFGKESYLGDTAGADDFVEAFYEEGSSYSREGVYSLPYMKSSEVMFYNVDLLMNAMPYYDSEITSKAQLTELMENIEWDEFMELCEVIKENMADIGETLEVPFFYDSDGNFIISKLYQENISYATLTNGVGKIGFNDNSSTTAHDGVEYNKVVNLLNDLKEDYDKGIFTTKGAFGEYGSNNFVAQKTVFSIGSSGGAGYNFPATKTFEVGICKVPYSNNNPLYVSQGPTLCLLNAPQYSDAENEQLTKYAFKFLKYITNGEVNSKLCVNGSEGYVPVRQSAYETQTFLSFMRNGENYAKTADVVINDIDGHYFNSPVFKGSATLREEIAGVLTDVLLGKLTAQQALDNCISNTILKM